MKTRRSWYNILAIGCVMALMLIFVRVPTAQADPIPLDIDPFTQGAFNRVLTWGGSEISSYDGQGSLTSVLGTQRDACLTLKSGTSGTGTLLVYNSSGINYLSMSLNDTIKGTAKIQWDGTAAKADCTINSTGLTATDLTANNNTGILVSVRSSDGVRVDLTVTIWTGDTGTGIASYTQKVQTPIASGSRLDLFMPFTGFTTQAGTPDFTKVRAIELLMDGTKGADSADMGLILTENTTAYEYGDLPTSGIPSPYSTNILGAYHITHGLMFGDSVDTEFTHNASVAANGDDTNQSPPDDEDGVTPSFYSGTQWSGGYGKVIITTHGCSALGGCIINGWIDWSRDGDFNDSLEQIIDGTIPAGFTGSGILSGDASNQTFAFSTPNPIPDGYFYYARYRICKTDTACNSSDNTDTAVDDGEIEDYRYFTSPLAVTLESFTAEPGAGQVLVSWATVSETDNAGFNLYRATSEDGDRSQINEKLIPAQAPGSTDGHAYEWQDGDVEPGQTYFYWLEDVDLDGSRTMHGPVSATYALDANKPAGPTAVRLQGLTALPISAALPWAGALILAVGAGAALLRRRR